jgi:hypothetical protein
MRGLSSYEALPAIRRTVGDGDAEGRFGMSDAIDLALFKFGRRLIAKAAPLESSLHLCSA